MENQDSEFPDNPFDADSFEYELVPPLSEQEDPVEFIMSGQFIKPPLYQEGVELPVGPPGWFPQLRFDILEEVGSGEQVSIYDTAGSIPELLVLTHYASRIALVKVEEAFFWLFYMRIQRAKKATSPPPPPPTPQVMQGPMNMFSMMQMPTASQPPVMELEGAFIIKRWDAIHSAFPGRSLILEKNRKTARQFSKLYRWMSKYYSM